MTTLDSYTSADQVYYVRVIASTNPSTDTGTVSWSSTDRTAPFLLEVLADIATTPGWLKVNVSNGPPGSSVTFYVDGGSTVLFTAALDASGQIVGMSIPLPSLAAGTHSLSVISGVGPVDSQSFNVLNGPVNYPIGEAADNAPVAATQTNPILRWAIQDLLPGGETYLFPINPEQQSSPHAPRVYASETTTAPDGQPLVFEGFPVAVDWTLQGKCLTQAFYEKLEHYLHQPRRVYVIDGHLRAWTVTFESMDWAPLKAAYNDWAGSYTLKLLIYGMVQL